jgi:uncharacterized membrane protein
MAAQPIPSIRIQNQWWVVVALGIMVAAIFAPGIWLLNFVHVFFGVLWTGADIFMGFIFGPVMRRVEPPVRRQVMLFLVPRTLFYFPTLAIVTSTSGWYLSQHMGLWNAPFPDRYWLYATAVLVAILTLTGVLVLLPTNLRMYFELRKEKPDLPKVMRLTRLYIRMTALDGLLQVATVAIMAKLATGI